MMSSVGRLARGGLLTRRERVPACPPCLPGKSPAPPSPGPHAMRAIGRRATGWAPVSEAGWSEAGSSGAADSRLR